MKMLTNIRSLLGALSRAMNLINPEVENHHQQTAYFAFFIGREMGMERLMENWSNCYFRIMTK